MNKTHCNTLQHTATHCNTLQRKQHLLLILRKALHHVLGGRGVLPCRRDEHSITTLGHRILTCLFCFVTPFFELDVFVVFVSDMLLVWLSVCYGGLQCGAVCCIVLQCVALLFELDVFVVFESAVAVWLSVCCSMLQWVAVRCSVVQCVAVCGTPL